MKNERNGQAYAVYLTNGLLYDRLHTLAAEYALPVRSSPTWRWDGCCGMWNWCVSCETGRCRGCKIYAPSFSK